MARESSLDELASVVIRLRGMLLSEQDATAAVSALARVAQKVVTSAVGAGVSLFDDAGRRVSAAATDTLVESADTVQYRLGEGPCLTAWATGKPQRVDDTTDDLRWSRWQAAAAKAGVRSMLSVPLVYGGACLGALKVYARAPGVFGKDEETLLGSLAEAAATLFGAAQPVDSPERFSDSLQSALQSRELITLAAGILIARDHVSPETARFVLAEQARVQGRRMVEVAAEVLERERTVRRWDR